MPRRPPHSPRRLIDSDCEIDAAMRIYRETEGNPLFVVEADARWT